MQGVLGVFNEVDATVDAIGDLKQGGRYRDISVFMPTLDHEIEHAVGAPESPVRRFTLIGGLLGVTFGYWIAIWTSDYWPLVVGGKAIFGTVAAPASRKGGGWAQLMLATLGHSAPTARGFAIMATLLLVMVGGAWVPAFVFPRWLQEASLYVPTRWAVDGLDGATWRGLPFSSAVLPMVVLAGSAAVCLAVAIWRFRWEE